MFVRAVLEHTITATLFRNLLAVVSWYSYTIRALHRVVDVDLPDSAEQLTVLEGGMRAQDDKDTFAEATTWVPECKWYKKIQCTCEHVQFRRDDYSLRPGWDRLFHLPGLQMLFNSQHWYRAEIGNDYIDFRKQGRLFWYSDRMGWNFKNSLDVGLYVYTSHAQIEDMRWCPATSECALGYAFALLVDLAMHMSVLGKTLASEFAEEDIQHFRDLFEDSLNHVRNVMLWRETPWWLLLERPSWSAGFLFILDEIKALLAQGVLGASSLLPRQDHSVSIEREVARLHAVGGELGRRSVRCLRTTFGRRADGRVGGPVHARRKPATSHECEPVIRVISQVAFNPRYEHSPVSQFVLFGSNLRSLLPMPPRSDLWPSRRTRAMQLRGSWIVRMCGQRETVVHRQVGRAALHFLAADVVDIAYEPFLELLWYASSDDRCVMVGTSSHGLHADIHYNYAHTLPGAHLVHWRCSIASHTSQVSVGERRSRQGQEEGAKVRAEAASTGSFSGFLSVTACRLPADVVDMVRGAAGDVGDAGRSGDAEEVHVADVTLIDDTVSGWRPEPLRVCMVPRPSRRFLSACSATLHNAAYVHRLAPFAVEDWINYHLLIGVDHFTIFDTDGSYAPYLQHFIERGVVTYRARWPWLLSSKLGLLSSGVQASQRRPLITEPHALETCVWSNRHVSDWVTVLHSFEEYLHSPMLASTSATQGYGLGTLLRRLAVEMPGLAVMELTQEPMGGPRATSPKSVLSTWLRRRGDLLGGKSGQEYLQAAALHGRPFGFIVDPLNVMQTAVHQAQARADGQTVVSVSAEILRVNHYVDLGSNASRCVKLVGGCEEMDDSILWAEQAVVNMRHA